MGSDKSAIYLCRGAGLLNVEKEGQDGKKKFLCHNEIRSHQYYQGRGHWERSNPVGYMVRLFFYRSCLRMVVMMLMMPWNYWPISWNGSVMFKRIWMVGRSVKAIMITIQRPKTHLQEIMEHKQILLMAELVMTKTVY